MFAASLTPVSAIMPITKKIQIVSISKIKKYICKFIFFFFPFVLVFFFFFAIFVYSFYLFFTIS